MKHSAGISVLEVIIAAAIFVIFATPAVIVVIQGINMNRLSVEQTVATQFAAEGIEAVKSIKNQAYSNLLTPNPTPRGVTRNGSNVWAFQADNTNNTFTHNTTNNYIRTVKVESVARDAVPPDGNIVASGGTADPDTKKVSSTVTWNFNTARPESVTLISYLTDWRKALTSTGGLLIYGDGTIKPKFRTFDSSSGLFSTESNSAPDSINGLTFSIKTSPTKTEAVAGFVNSAGLLQMYCYDGAAWTAEWSVTVGGTGTTRRFDIAYEKTTGDAVVLYSTNSTSNELAYRTKSGSVGCGSTNWSSATSYAANRTSGIVQWVKMSEDKRSGQNLIAVMWADDARDLGTGVWNGTTIGNEPASALETNLEVVSAAQDIESFDIEYETSSGNIMVVWGSGGTATANGAFYARCTGGTATCTWGAKTAMPTFANDATTLDLAANPNTNELVFASIGNAGSDLQAGYWSGSAWTNTNDLDASSQTPTAGMKLVSTGWLISGATTRSVVVYADSTATTTSISYYVGNGGTFAAQTDFANLPVPAAHRYYDIQLDPIHKEKLVLIFSDNSFDLFAKQLTMTSVPAFTWSNTEGGSALETTLGQALRSPFGFAYWRNP